MPSTSIKLSGNLGSRHRHLNDLVRDAFQRNLSISDFGSPTDQLFAIDLASKQKNVGYTLQSLKNDDMLYVSRALKSFWLLESEWSNIINPSYLENELFPQMTLQAVNKMRNWIQLHLRNPERCKEFYQFYKNRCFDTAAKFLWHCSSEYILSEVHDILEKITPKLLKVLSEKVPKVTQIYFSKLKENQVVLKYYLENETKFFANIKYLLKPDADVFFYVLENFFDARKFSAFNSTITKYIMRNHKTKFIMKPELYTTRILNMRTLAKNLGSQEIKELVVNLAKAEYLGSWFNFKAVEPLIKRLSAEERKSFQKLVFVDKTFGEPVKQWPYAIPTSPEINNLEANLFEDTTIVNLHDYSFHHYGHYTDSDSSMCFRAMLKKRKYAKWCKTPLDELFEKYRFSNYKQTLQELQRRLRAENSAQNRQYMLLVLISKTGGQTEYLISFLDLLAFYKNEPVQIRAAIVRSLVKRAFVWRLAPEHWARLLEWGHGLGLDGSPSEAACDEGLHAVVIRDLLAGVTPSDTVWRAYLLNFSTLAEYNLRENERIRLSARLSTALLAAAQSDPNETAVRLQLLLQTLTDYRIRFDTFPGTVETIKAFAESDLESANVLIGELYKAGVARKILMRENFELIQTDESYVNALRHDTSILDDTTKLEKLIDSKNLKHEKFLRKLAVYFTEKDGLRERYHAIIELRANSAPDKILARPLALLSGSKFSSQLKTFDSALLKTPQRQLAAALRANAHLVRPAFDTDSFGWRALGAKAVANRVATCRQQDAERYFQETLSWSRTLRLAVVLSKRLNMEYEVFKVFASKRPGAALMSSLRYFESKDNNLDPRIWNIVKPLISEIDSVKLRNLAIRDIDSVVPTVIMVEYFVLLYCACKNNLPDLQMTLFRQIPAILPELDEQFIKQTIDGFLNDYLENCDKVTVQHKEISHIYLFVGIIARFLILSTSETMLEERIQKFAMPLFKQFEVTEQVYKGVRLNEIYLDTFLLALRYNKVYFDDRYVSCLPIFERLVDWMHSYLPIERWFDRYVIVDLVMIYFKAVRHCLNKNPGLFGDETKKLDEGPNMLGTIFGIFLTAEIEELTRKYFFSITELYGKNLVDFLEVYFYGRGRRDKSVEKFTRAVLNALLMNKSIASSILAKHIFIAFREQLGNEKFSDDIEEVFKESEIKELSVEQGQIDKDAAPPSRVRRSRLSGRYRELR